MTIQEIKDKIAEIAMMEYDTEKTKSDMKDALDELWDEIDGFKPAPAPETIADIWKEAHSVLRASPEDLDKMLAYIENQFNTKLVCVDSNIDDMGDGEIDEYVMRDCYDFKYKGISFYIRIFYGNNSRAVGTYELSMN